MANGQTELLGNQLTAAAATGSFHRRVEGLFNAAGIELDGEQPWDVQVNDSRLFRRILAQGSLGLGESYMDGWWDCQSLDQFFHRLLKAGLQKQVQTLGMTWAVCKARLSNRQSLSRAHQVGRQHYDIGNDLYRAMLDSRMNYSCGYWKGVNELDQAQEQKLDLICRKLQLKPGQRLLDIGCGWGAMARYAAENYGVSVVGVTISEKQAELVRETCRDLPVEARLQDYRALDEPFERIVSIGMFEHVGPKNYRTYMQVAARCLADDGLFLLHSIGGNESAVSIDPWIERYIFPNGVLPSARQITRAIEGIFMLEDWHGFGLDYDRTLMAWHRNFEAAWPQLRDLYDERFYRQWRYYLLACAGSFRARVNQLWQIVLSKNGAPAGYRAAR